MDNQIKITIESSPVKDAGSQQGVGQTPEVKMVPKIVVESADLALEAERKATSGESNVDPK